VEQGRAAVRIAVVSQHADPEVTSASLRVSSWLRTWTAMGHDVTLITAVPNHPEGVIHPAYRGRLLVRERMDGARVVRVWVASSRRKTALGRLLAYASFGVLATAVGWRAREAPDVVVATVPPPFAGLAGALVAARHRAPLVVDVRDVWPDAAIAVGALRPGPTARVLGVLLRRLYRRADRLVAVTEGVAGQIGGRAMVVPNGAEPRLAASLGAAGEVRARLGLGDAFVVGYVGNHGLAQGLETLVAAADLLRRHGDVRVMMVGEGPRRRALMDLARARGLSNVLFHPPVPVAEVGAFLGAADVLIVPLRSAPVFSTAMPAKLLDAWACGRPVLLGFDGEARRTLETIGGGAYAPSEDPEAIAAAVLRLRDLGAEALDAMGARGRRWVEGARDRDAAARRLGEELEALRAASG
jgi:glycosyltransferase involved in cell wall biosynthesis